MEQGVLVGESILMGVEVPGAGGTNRRVHIDGCGVAGAGVTNRRVHIDGGGGAWSRGY